MENVRAEEAVGVPHARAAVRARACQQPAGAVHREVRHRRAVAAPRAQRRRRRRRRRAGRPALARRRRRRALSAWRPPLQTSLRHQRSRRSASML